MNRFLRLLAIAGLLSSPLPAAAQGSTATPDTHCSLLPLDPAQRAARAGLVIEGEVLDARSFWDSRHRRIYTAHRVQVFSALKGTPAAELTVLTEGGTVGLARHELTNTLALQPGEQGILFLTSAAFPSTESVGEAWTAYGSRQGFIRYDLGAGTAAEPFRVYGPVSAAFYAELTAATGQPRRIVQPNPVLVAAIAQALAPVAAKGQAPVIAGLSPAVIPAGTGAVLTITGTGFGAARGSGFVEFRNADDGGQTFVRPQESEYVSWTDTRIQVRVPSLGQPLSPAGSGTVRVTTNDKLTTTSLATLTVPYAVSNVLTTTTGVLVRPNPINSNGRGGYSFRFEQGFAANAAASAAWRRALDTWRCQTGMNWDVETTSRTNSGAAEDNENSIGFDQGTEQLPANVLGRTTSYYKGCFRPNGSLVFYVQEMDMQFDDATNWQFGPGAPTASQLDFQSVALHELGHAQQLAHVILPRAVMHYAIARGQLSRATSPDDVVGGRLVLRTRGFVPQGCGPAPMLPAPLLSFTAEAAAGGVQLSWTTREECFLAGFEVQRAAGPDTSSWTALATIPLAGSGTGTYRYLDAQAPAGLTYYRLRLRRPDNTFDAAPPVLATPDASAATQPVLFPNPLRAGILQLQYAAQSAGRLGLFFYDAVGRRHQSSFLDYQPGLNLLTIPAAADLRPGLYLLRYRDSQGHEGYLRFVRGSE